MNPLTRILSHYLGNPWPNARPLPPHVAAVRIDPKLLLLHMDRAAKPPAPERDPGR